jgi:hypothetical protein
MTRPPWATGTPLVLRLSLAPGFYAERRVVVDGPKADVGTLRFATSEDMKEFNRPGREIVMTLPTGR